MEITIAAKRLYPTDPPKKFSRWTPGVRTTRVASDQLNVWKSGTAAVIEIQDSTYVGNGWRGGEEKEFGHAGQVIFSLSDLKKVFRELPEEIRQAIFEDSRFVPSTV